MSLLSHFREERRGWGVFGAGATLSLSALFGGPHAVEVLGHSVVGKQVYEAIFASGFPDRRPEVSRYIQDRVARSMGATVRCSQTENGDVGQAYQRPKFIILDPDYVCRPLADYMGGSPYYSDRLAEAVLVISHEVQHLKKPEANESDTECRALQTEAVVAQELDIPKWLAQGLATAATHTTPDTEYLPGPECRPGGEQDLGLKPAYFRDSPWLTIATASTN